MLAEYFSIIGGIPSKAVDFLGFKYLNILFISSFKA